MSSGGPGQVVSIFHQQLVWSRQVLIQNRREREKLWAHVKDLLNALCKPF